MIERLYLKECIGFREASLEFRPGLVVFTGPSGAGKSVLLGALLALFGHKNVEAALSEVAIAADLDLEKYGLQSEEVNVLRAVKKEKVRYFLNMQALSKRSVQEIFAPYVAYLHQKDQDFFKSENMLAIIDSLLSHKHRELLGEFREVFTKLQRLRKELEEIEEKERTVAERKEFLEFEIAKIEGVAPKEGEYEELMQIKRELSKKEKIAEALARAEGVFEYEGAVLEALELLGEESDFFTSALGELQELFATHRARLEELEFVDIEEVLGRIEELSQLKRKYGSIEDALTALEEKKEELARLENIAFEKKQLAKELQETETRAFELAATISKARKEGAQRLVREVNEHLAALRLPKASIHFEKTALTMHGIDAVQVRLAGVEFHKISSGEYNRLRLAFMAARGTEAGEGGVLVLDEIDANISGEESMAVAKILKKLSRRYQIFAISHQAQLASQADQHFLVTKEEGQSRVRELEPQERVAEIARIISGEKITPEAMNFAKKLLKESA